MKLSLKHVRFFLVYYMFFLICPVFSNNIGVEDFENSWIVVIDKFATYEAASEENNFQKLEGAILLSTHFTDLDPGWYFLIKGKYNSREEAQSGAEEILDINVIHYFLNYTGDLYDFEEYKYRQTELDDEEYNMLQERIFRYPGKESPDGKRWVLFPAHEEDPEEFALIRTDQDAMPISDIFVFADTTMIAWSPKSDKFVFIDHDAFYYSGAQQLYVIDVFSGEYIAVNLHDIIEGKDFGDRSKLTITDLAWLEPGDAIIFTLEIDYLGTSGDDMIDQHRIEKLGDNFGRNDPKIVGDYVIYLKPRLEHF